MQYYPLGNSTTSATNFNALATQLEVIASTSYNRALTAVRTYGPMGAIPQAVKDALYQNLTDLKVRFQEAVDAGLVPGSLSANGQKAYRNAVARMGAMESTLQDKIGVLNVDNNITANPFATAAAEAYTGQAGVGLAPYKDGAGSGLNSKILLAAVAGVIAFMALK